MGNKLAILVLGRLRQGGITRLRLARIVQGVPVSKKKQKESGEMVKNFWCYSRGPEFCSQHLYSAYNCL